MGAEFEVNSVEEMRDLMCDNVAPKEKPQYWYFTFGYGQMYAGHCVKIKGTFASARAKMCKKYGTDWGFQYSEKDWKELEENPERYWDMEEILEVIE